MTKRKKPHRRTTRPSPHDVAIDVDGSIMPHTPAEVRAILDQMFERGHVIAVVMDDPEHGVGVMSLIPPSARLLDVLTTAVESFREALRHAGQVS